MSNNAALLITSKLAAKDVWSGRYRVPRAALSAGPGAKVHALTDATWDTYCNRYAASIFTDGIDFNTSVTCIACLREAERLGAFHA